MYSFSISAALRLPVLFATGLALSSCLSEGDLGGRSLTQLTIQAPNASSAELNIDFGDSCIIAPKFVQSGGQAQALHCTWSVGSYDAQNGTKGALTEVAKGERFSYFFTRGGDYYVHLNATNGETGLAQDYIVHVNRAFEKGILISAIDADGRGNLSFVKTLTAEDSAAGKQATLREHCLEVLNPGLDTRGLLGASVVQLATGTTRKLIVAFNDRCYFIDPATFELVKTLRYDEIYSGFRATHFSAQPSSTSYPYVYDNQLRKHIHIEREFEYLYQHASHFYNTASFDDLFLLPKPSLNGRDLYTVSDIGVNYAQSEVAEYSPYTGAAFGQKKSTGDLLQDQNILSTFRRKLSGVAAPTYVLTQLRNQPSTLRLYTLVHGTTGKYGNATDPYREIYTASFVEQQNVPSEVIPTQGTRMIEARTANVLFYAIGGRLFSYFAFNTEPTLPTAATLNFAGETITALGINEQTQELYVGTYNEGTRRGSLRVYDATDLRPNAQPKLHFANSTGRIVELRYKE